MIAVFALLVYHCHLCSVTPFSDGRVGSPNSMVVRSVIRQVEQGTPYPRAWQVSVHIRATINTEMFTVAKIWLNESP